jgi:L-amino acid N-acyltransferase YncA
LTENNDGRIRSTNTASLALHARHGFEIVGGEREIARVRGQWVDVVLMQLVLSDT